MISIQVYEKLTRQREKDFAVLYEIWNKVPKLSESEIESDIELLFWKYEAKDEISSNRSGVKQGLHAGLCPLLLTSPSSLLTWIGYLLAFAWLLGHNSVPRNSDKLRYALAPE